MQPKTIFAADAAAPRSAAAAPSRQQRLPALSSKLEYPASREALEALLANQAAIDVCGCDAFGLSALHKLAAWNASELLAILLPHLPPEHINAPGGDAGYTALHHCVDMGSKDALALLLTCPHIDADRPDAKGRTPRALAAEMGTLELLFP